MKEYQHYMYIDARGEILPTLKTLNERIIVIKPINALYNETTTISN